MPWFRFEPGEPPPPCRRARIPRGRDRSPGRFAPAVLSVPRRLGEPSAGPTRRERSATGSRPGHFLRSPTGHCAGVHLGGGYAGKARCSARHTGHSTRQRTSRGEPVGFDGFALAPGLAMASRQPSPRPGGGATRRHRPVRRGGMVDRRRYAPMRSGARRAMAGTSPPSPDSTLRCMR